MGEIFDSAVSDVDIEREMSINIIAFGNVTGPEGVPETDRERRGGGGPKKSAFLSWQKGLRM
jgi:hypothetical protein